MRRIYSETQVTMRKNWQLNFIALFIYAVMITDSIRLLATLLNSQTLESATETLRNVMYILIFLGYSYFASKKARGSYAIGVAVYFCVLGASVLINPALKEHAETLSLLFISRFLLGFIMISDLDDPIALCKKVAKVAWVLPAYVLLYWITPHDLSTGSAYSMTFSYNLLLPAVACIIQARLLREKKLRAWILVTVAAIGVLFFGSRGTLICLVVALIATAFLDGRKYTFNRLVWQTVIFLVVAVLLLFAEDILAFLSKLMPESRTLRLLQDSEFFWESNRDSYSKMAKEALKESPFSVYGLAGDTYVYAGKGFAPMELGRHSHNVFVELLISYGVLIGGPLCIWLGYRIITAFKGIKENPERKVMCILFVAALIPYILLSGSTCQSHYHWLLIGAVVNKVAGLSQKQKEQQQ